MKKSLIHFLEFLIKFKFIWLVFKPITSFGIVLYELKRNQEKIKSRNIYFNKYFNSLEVKSGPFVGMNYTEFDSVGSAIFPKLLGTYEMELSSVIEKVLKKKYLKIIDIGSAEGYYAIGFALKSNANKIYAYDLDSKARRLCWQMAVLNKVEDKLNISSKITSNDLNEMDLKGNNLIICDCEGYEMDLFNNENLSNLNSCDLLIETHNHKNIYISTYLKDLFVKSHKITSIYSLDDVQKALIYDLNDIKDIDLNEKKKLLAEGRAGITEWLFMEPK